MRKSPPRAYPREQESPNREEAFGSGSKDNDSSGQYQSKLLSTKATAKEVEKEKLTLLNRIALLEREEQKVLKKIEDAKGRALDILSKKSRNNKVHDDKERERLQRERELEAKRNQIDNLKVQMAEKVREAKTEKELASKEKADEIRENMRVGPRLTSETEGEVQRTACSRTCSALDAGPRHQTYHPSGATEEERAPGGGADQGEAALRGTSEVSRRE